MSILTSVVKGVAITAGTLLVAGSVVGYFGIRELKKRQALSVAAYHESVKADLVALNEAFEVAKAAGDQVEMVRIKGEIDVVELAISIGNNAAMLAVA